MYQRKSAAVATTTTGEESGRPKRRRRRRPRRMRKKIERCAKVVVLPCAGLFFGALWIRLLWRIASNSGGGGGGSVATTANTEPSFLLEAGFAPRCLDLDSPDDIGTTFTTQLSDDRLWMMEHHCAMYGPHPMSIAVYTNRTRTAILADLKGMGCRIDSGDAAATTAHVTVAVLDAHAHGAWNSYPVNELRNLALEGVRTTHALIADADFWPSTKLHEALSHRAVRQQLFDDPKLALVVPAFQLKRAETCADETVECREEHVQRMPMELFAFQYMLEGNHSVEIFDPTNRGGHGSTNYQHWYQHQLLPHSEAERVVEIPCLKSRRYEPFLVIRYCRELVPPFQPAFSGYGKNKMAWVRQVVASGFRLAQVGGQAYLVHYPHAISASRRDWNRAPEELVEHRKNSNNNNNNYSVRRPKKSDGDLGFGNYPRGRVDDLFVRFREWLDATIPTDRARVHLCENAEGNDDARLWIDPTRKRWKTPKKKKNARDELRNKVFHRNDDDAA